MVWLIALVCLGLVGIAGFYQGPVRAAFSFFGIVIGAMLAGPLSPLTKHLLPLFGLSHPVWQIFLPQAIAFLVVLVIFKIAGQVLHQKIAVFYKYKVDDRSRISWERMYARVGFCVGLLNGTVYFILLMIPLYVGGYFTTEAQANESAPAGARFLSGIRADLTRDKMDHVVAAYDPTPPQVYKAADIATLVLHNPLSENRLAHYPPFLLLAERPEFKNLSTDITLQQMIQSQAPVADIVKYPAVQAILTNSSITTEISGLIANDLDDLSNYLMSGQSAKYDSEPILGIWKGSRSQTMAELRRQQPDLTPVQLRAKESDIFPIVEGLSLTGLPDGQMILKKLNATSADNTVISAGPWKHEGSTYQVTLPGSHPETSEVKVEDNKLFLPKDGYVLVFEKEM
jgi:uncharacterized membrane protein required for colicin V production